MRTKTPQQIQEQWQRMTKFATNRTNIKRIKHAADISKRYWDNIYRANGIEDRFAIFNADLANDIWDNSAQPRSIYAGY